MDGSNRGQDRAAPENVTRLRQHFDTGERKRMRDNENGNTTTTTDNAKPLRHYPKCARRLAVGKTCICAGIEQRRLKANNKFLSRGKEVYKYSFEHPNEYVCTARSATYAVRIKNALNKHVPDERGQ